MEDHLIANQKRADRQEHTASPDCWCHPFELEPGVWIHHPAPQVLPQGSSDPVLDGYVPDIKGTIQGDDA